ncbi:MAG: DUF1761 domain-containing protein [Nanoarchaeota archaeon]
MLQSVDVNLLAVLVSAVVSMIVGMSWYSQTLFGKEWMKLMNISKKDIEKAKNKSMKKEITAAFVSNLVLAYVLSLFLKYTGASTASEGLIVGFLVWLGFQATLALGSVLWEGRPVKLYLINVAHYLVNLLVLSLILVSWA